MPDRRNFLRTAGCATAGLLIANRAIDALAQTRREVSVAGRRARVVDIHAHTEEGLTGVWVYTEKVAAIGVKLSRGVTLHGFSLNVDPDLDYYRHIVACGITSREVTSMARLLKHDVPMDAVRRALVRHFAECCGVSTQYLVPSDL